MKVTYCTTENIRDFETLETGEVFRCVGSGTPFIKVENIGYLNSNLDYVELANVVNLKTGEYEVFNSNKPVIILNAELTVKQA